MRKFGDKRVLSIDDVKRIRSAPVSFTGRSEIADAAGNTLTALDALYQKWFDLGREHQSIREFSARLKARNHVLERENEKLVELKGQELGDAIFDTYARMNEEMASKVVSLQAKLAEAHAEIAAIRADSMRAA